MHQVVGFIEITGNFVNFLVILCPDYFKSHFRQHPPQLPLPSFALTDCIDITWTLYSNCCTDYPIFIRFVCYI